jgi:glycerophosphoryl diester phosphodiesterase
MQLRRLAAISAAIAATAVPAAAVAADPPGRGGDKAADHRNDRADARGDNGGHGWYRGGKHRPGAFPAPLVIGHRGASGHRPEHTLASYKLAIQMGADFVEPDLVATKDGVLIARHEPNIGATTDVAEKFPDRKTTKIVDGVEVEDWFASDFTLKEIKTLRAVQPMADRDQSYNGLYEIPTLREVLKLVRKQSRKLGRPVGVYPETKHPTFHQQLGLPLERRLVRTLDRFNLDDADDPVYVQSFEQSNLKELNELTDVKLVQLVDAYDVDDNGLIYYDAPYDRPYDWTVSGDPALLARTFGFFTTDAGLEEISTYADGIGPWKPYIQSWARTDANGDGTIGDENGDGNVDGADRTVLPPTDLVDRAHAHGLEIHTWTFRSEPYRLTYDDQGDPTNEYLRFFEIGVDGVFSDFPDDAVAARQIFWGS